MTSNTQISKQLDDLSEQLRRISRSLQGRPATTPVDAVKRELRSSGRELDWGGILAELSELEPGFTTRDIPMSRPTVAKAVAKGYLKMLQEPARTGGAGRPATRYSLTPKGQRLAQKAIAAH